MDIQPFFLTILAMAPTVKVFLEQLSMVDTVDKFKNLEATTLS